MDDVIVNVEPETEDVEEVEWPSLVLEVRDTVSTVHQQLSRLTDATTESNSLLQSRLATQETLMNQLQELVRTQQQTITQLTSQLSETQTAILGSIQTLLAPPVVEIPQQESLSEEDDRAVAETVPVETVSLEEVTPAVIESKDERRRVRKL